MVSQSWQFFFSEVAKDINCNSTLEQILYTTQEEFYLEDFTNRHLGNPNVRSNQIKKQLHQILTNAIFNYCPCKDLLDLSKTKKPSPETWITGANKWLSLASEPLQHVSKHCFFLTVTFMSLTICICRNWKQRMVKLDPIVQFLMPCIETSRDGKCGTILKCMLYMN